MEYNGGRVDEKCFSIMERKIFRQIIRFDYAHRENKATPCLLLRFIVRLCFVVGLFFITIFFSHSEKHRLDKSPCGADVFS